MIQDYSGGEDEGRAMLQIVHDVAPGSPLAFATADVSEGQFATNIQSLANAGAKVITDDVVYLDEPFFQPGMVAQAVNNVVTNNGVSYFSSAGNYATQAYDTASPLSYGSNPLHFVTDSIPAIDALEGGSFPYLDFDPSSGTNDRMTVTLAHNGGIVLSMQWDQPYYTASGVTTDLDIFVLNHSTGAIVAYSAADNLANQTPVELVGFQNTGSSAQFDIVINKYCRPESGRDQVRQLRGQRLRQHQFRHVRHQQRDDQLRTRRSPMPWRSGPFRSTTSALPRAFSSFGPVTFLFDASGNRLASPLDRGQAQHHGARRREHDLLRR